MTQKEGNVMSQSNVKSQIPLVRKFVNLPFRRASHDETAAQLGLITLETGDRFQCISTAPVEVNVQLLNAGLKIRSPDDKPNM